MKRYRVLNVDGYTFELQDETGAMGKIFLSFYDIDPPRMGEVIHLPEILFDKKANEGVVHFYFGKMSEPYGKNITQENIDEYQDEILIIERDNKRYYLKRFYG